MNDFNLMRAGQVMGGVVALEGVYDLYTSSKVPYPEQTKILKDRGFGYIKGGAIGAVLSSLIPLRISHFPTSVQSFLSKNLKTGLTVLGCMMLAHGVEQVYKASQLNSLDARAKQTKEGFGQAIFGSAALIARVWN